VLRNFMIFAPRHRRYMDATDTEADGGGYCSILASKLIALACRKWIRCDAG
jgi:hypothetical protein